MDRRGLDKGTLAAAHIGLTAGRPEAARSPDSVRAAAPCQAPCSVRAGVPEAGGPGAKCAAVTTRATASSGNDGGLPAPGASANAAPCRAVALRARRADAWQPSPLPRGPVVARRYAPTGTGPARKAAADGRGRAVRVQQWTAKAGSRDLRARTEGRRPKKAKMGVVAGRKAHYLFRSNNQGQGRTADLPPFSDLCSAVICI